MLAETETLITGSAQQTTRTLPAILITLSKPRDRFHLELDRVINIKLMIKPNRSQVAEISWFEVVELGHLLVGERKAPEVEIRGHVRGVVRASDDGDAALNRYPREMAVAVERVKTM